MINLYIIDYYVSIPNGISTYIQNLRKYFSDNDNLVLHFIWVNAKNYPAITKSVDSDGITQYYFPTDFVEAITISTKELSHLSYIINECQGKDSIVFHFNWINHAGFSYLVKQHIKCTTLLTRHYIPWRDAITEDYASFRKMELNEAHTAIGIAFHLYNQEFQQYLNFDHFICVTHHAKKDLIDRFSKKAGNITVIPNGIDTIQKAVKTSSKQKLRKEYGFSSSDKIILYAGRIYKRKGVFDLIETIELLSTQDSNIRLVIAGQGALNEMLLNIKKFWSRITITGSLSKNVLYDFYQMSDIGIVPSYVEQCSYTAIEMMYFGLPVIVANVDGLKEIVPDDCGLKVDLLLKSDKACIDTKQLSKKIRYYLDNEAIGKLFATNAKKNIRKNFTAKSMAVATISVYKKLILRNSNVNSLVPKLIDQPLVSVLLICYNADKYLRECIESILRQTYSTFELIIINNGSTDRTKEIINLYFDKRIVYVENSKYESVANVLNKGIALAQGQYIAHIDADKLMHPERLAKQVGFLEAPVNEKIAIVGSYHSLTEASFMEIATIQYPVDNVTIKCCMFFQNVFSRSSTMFKTNSVKGNKFSSKYEYVEDYSFWFKLAAKYEFANIPECLTIHRILKKDLPVDYQEKYKMSMAELLAQQLDKLGLQYSQQELMVHLAICLGYGKQYFNSPEKIKTLASWVPKVLNSLSIYLNISTENLFECERYIMKHYCAIFA